jgi:hypothetical protein
MEDLENITNLHYNPVLKQLLINYVSRMYEEDGIYDEYHLMQEYYLLQGENKLHLLFVEEKLSNYLKDGNN